MPVSSPAAPGRAVTRNVLLLGLVSMFADVASELCVPLLPAFLVSLGAGALALGAVEGAAEAAASGVRLFSGRWADRGGRLRRLALWGYGLAGVTKPLLAAALAPWHVLALRCIDRVGKGLRGPPRDKLIAASAPASRLAEAFAFHRGMDHLGAALGPLLAAGLLWLWPGRLRWAFLLAGIPAALAVVALLLVREAGREAPRVEGAKLAPPPSPAAIPAPLLAALLLFNLGNSTDTLLLLRAQGLGVPLAQVPLLWVVLHALRSGLSWPLGRLSERIGRKSALSLGWVWYALCYLGFAWARAPWHFWALFAAYGVSAGLTEGSERALVAAAVPAEQRGAALGAYGALTGFALLGASLLAGALWHWVSPQAALAAGAALASLAALALWSFPIRGAWAP